ncbi:GPW/gp25 family protein [Mycobacterium sp. C3-094]
MNIAYPFGFDDTGRTASVDDATHLRDLISQVLFTAPGERVMRPDFGSGLLALTFEPNSADLATATQFLVEGSLRQWLAHLITVETVDVIDSDGSLQVTVDYIVNRTQQRRTDQFTASGAPV